MTDSQNLIDEKTIIISAWLPGGGVEKVIQNLIIDNQPFKDVSVLVLSEEIKFHWYKQIEDKVKFTDGFDSNNSSSLGLLLGLIKSFLIVKKELNNSNPKNILFTHSFLMVIFSFLRTNANVFFWPHNNLLNPSNFLKSKIRKLTYKLFKSSIDGILCVSESILAEAKLIGFSKADLVYNPIGEKFKNQFIYKPDLNKLVHIGFLDERKNTSHIIKALAKSNNNKLTLDIIGDGYLLEPLKEEVENLGLNNRVSFKGFLDMSKIQISCSALIMASKSEGFSMVISDALKSGIPLILPLNLDISKFITSEKRGKVFNLENITYLKEVLDNIDFLKIDSNEIKNTYINFYGKKAYSDRVSSFIKSV
jgi:glycosyltransferase involved in cell wall biosynthesis